MRAKELLVEYLTSVIPYQWEEQTKEAWYSRFMAPDNSSIEFMTTNLNNGGWEISWTRDNISSRIKTDPKTTNAILSTINKMIVDFVSSVKPNAIYVALTAHDPTKISIYQRMLGKVGYTGYEITDEEELDEKDLYSNYEWWEFT